MIRNMCQLGVSSFNGKTGKVYPTSNDYFNFFYESGEISDNLLKFNKSNSSLEYGDNRDAILDLKQALILGDN